MSIYLGNTAIKNIYLGNTQMNKLYLGNSLVYNSIIPFDLDASTLISRMTVKPAAALQNLISTTIAGLKTDGVYQLGDCMYVRGVHDSQAACQNWIKNAHHSTLSATPPTFTAKVGFTGNGSSSYINNNYTQSTDAVHLVNNNETIVVMCPTVGTANGKAILGCIQSSGVRYTYFYFYTGANEIMYINDANGLQTINTTNGDYLGISKTGTTIQGYKNGQPGGASGTSNNRTAQDISMTELAVNYGGVTGILGFNAATIGFTFYGGYLDATKMAALYTRIKYFYDNVGATF